MLINVIAYGGIFTGDDLTESTPFSVNVFTVQPSVGETKSLTFQNFLSFAEHLRLGVVVIAIFTNDKEIEDEFIVLYNII